MGSPLTFRIRYSDFTSDGSNDFATLCYHKHFSINSRIKIFCRHSDFTQILRQFFLQLLRIFSHENFCIVFMNPNDLHEKIMKFISGAFNTPQTRTIYKIFKPKGKTFLSIGKNLLCHKFTCFPLTENIFLSFLFIENTGM